MSKTGLKRDTKDKFYTHSDAVQQCVSAFQEHVVLTDTDVCVEPSAGNGAFLPFIRDTFHEYYLFDIAPEHPEILQQDFLELETNSFQSKKTHVIGNPPFGRQSTLAIQFIKKSATFAHTISFILPKSFMKERMQDYFPSCFHLVYQFELPKNSFLVDKQPHDVPCVFQIWVKQDTPRARKKKLVPMGYTFVKKEEQPDLAIRRVGVNCGHVDRCIQDKSIQSHYFLRFDAPLTRTMFQSLSKLEFPTKDFTVGPKSISKQDIIQQFNVLFISKK